MEQILHIFRKDTRRFWAEILASLGAVTLFAWMAPKAWQMDVLQRAAGWREFAGVAQLLLVMSWLLLLARAVHAEGLVGENQAWLTRPYEWGKLLAAKALFCLAYIYVPLLVAQCVLLRVAGFAVKSCVGGLAYDACLISAFLLLPLFAIAAVTSNFARMTLTLLGVLLATVGLVMLSGWLHNDVIQIPYTSRPLGLLLAVWLGLLVAALGIQYARRQTGLTRGLLLGPLLIIGLSVALYREHPDVEAAYPQGYGPAPVTLTFAADAAVQFHAYQATEPESSVRVEIPVDASGVPEGYATQIDLMKVTIEAPGVHWESQWQSNFHRYVPGVRRSMLGLHIDRAVYNQVRGHAVDLRIALGVTKLEAARTTQRTIHAGEFTDPNGGICAANLVGPGRRQGLHCRFALRLPTLTYETVHASPGSCGEDAAGPRLTGFAWAGGLQNEPATLKLSPVTMADQFFTFIKDDGKSYEGTAGLCPGTTVQYTEYSLGGRTREVFEWKGLVLPEKVAGESLGWIP